PADGLLRSAFVASVDEDVRVDEEHQNPSRTLYSSSRLEMSTKWPPLLNVGSGGSFGDLFAGFRNARKADSTSSEIVLFCRAASCLSCFMTWSSMTRVVFIWKTIRPHPRAVNRPARSAPWSLGAAYGRSKGAVCGTQLV